ncbi:hypothetical protein R1flu_023678 [Riccia fluitans]|uniref:Transposase n=1 Tax=Riccia fluitans TaxID=41844 RepID=A0ABD1XVP0_9MARC
MLEPLVIYVDCRFDRSRSGYHGTLPIINTEDDRVIEMVTLTRKQIGSSWKIETAALEEALTLLEQVLPGNRKCIAENWPKGRDAKYVEGGETHKAVKDFLKKYITESKMKFYIKAHENFISKTFHCVINKYATKRVHFDHSHMARLACTALDWNENIWREVRAVYNQGGNDTAVRRRASTDRKLVPRTSAWKSQLARKVFG